MLSNERDVQESPFAIATEDKCDPARRRAGQVATGDDSPKDPSDSTTVWPMLFVFVFIIIAGAMAFKICFQVDHRYHHRFIIALSIYDTYPLVVIGAAFYSIAGAAGILQVAFVVIDRSFLHDLFHFCLGYFAALHPALCVVAVLQVSSAAVEAFITVGGVGGRVFGFVGGNFWFGNRLTPFSVLLNNNYSHRQQRYQYIRGPFPIHYQTFG